LEVNKAGEHPVIFIIAVFINYGLQDKHVVRCPSFFCKPHLAIIDHFNIIKSMYSQSKSCVRLNNTLRDFFGNYVGVKQGENLSPNLFKIFINDLPDYLIL
jgi:hypothetical protein